MCSHEAVLLLNTEKMNLRLKCNQEQLTRRGVSMTHCITNRLLLFGRLPWRR